MGTKNEHELQVEHIAASVRGFWKRRQPVRIYHGSTNSTRPLEDRDPKSMVDTSQLNHVLGFDEKNLTINVEPNVPMDALVNETLKHGYLPLVVPEFPGITVGGAVQGAAGESSSFKHGAVHDTCTEYELVLGHGEVVTVSPQKQPDLFFGSACSYGTLGILTRITMKIQPARPYVHLTYTATGSADTTIALLKKELKRPDIDFVDAIQFSPDHGVVMTGVYANTPLRNRARFSRGIDEWFYIHADTVSKQHTTYTESIPVKDYYFRYDRGAFWGGSVVLQKLHLPFTRFFRWLANPLLHTRKVYQVMHAVNGAQRAIIQDICMPQKNFEQFVQFVQDGYQIYPLWFCPIWTSRSKLDKLSPGLVEGDILLNVGVWGMRNVTFKNHVRENRDLEKEAHRLGGRKVFYARAYYPEKEFWQIYDKKWYDTLRTKYHADVTFPTIYDKVVVRTQMPVSRKLLWKALFSRPFNR